MTGTATAQKKTANIENENIAPNPGTREALSARSEEALTATTPDHDAIAQRAYQLWQERGCPDGSADEDWLRAEKELMQTQPGPVS